ncbi:MAG: hypothetical protein VX278_07330 [Myxococcota bacterium]|nr:hypothetical protein [Myxococcota bacterium]
MLALYAFSMSVAQADIELRVEKMELDGLQIQNLYCQLPKDQPMAALQIGAAISKGKSNWDLCMPEGGAANITWIWLAKEQRVEVPAISNENAHTCVKNAAARIEHPMTARCSAVILMGNREEAEKAARTLDY